jgi:hypothetical protein
MEGICVYRILIRRPERKITLATSRHRWEDNIKMDLKEIRIESANWIMGGSGQNPVASFCEYGN